MASNLPGQPGTDRVRKRAADLVLVSCNQLAIGYEVARGGYRFVITSLETADEGRQVVGLEYCGGDEKQQRELGAYAKTSARINGGEAWPVFVTSIPDPTAGPVGALAFRVDE